MTHDEMRDRLSRAATEAARNVPGVAFLRPGLADLLRASAASRAGRDARPSGRTSGVRVSALPEPSRWHIDIRFVARTSHRTLDVARAVRAAVARAVSAVPGARDSPVEITVTVTGVL